MRKSNKPITLKDGKTWGSNQPAYTALQTLLAMEPHCSNLPSRDRLKQALQAREKAINSAKRARESEKGDETDSPADPVTDPTDEPSPTKTSKRAKRAVRWEKRAKLTLAELNAQREAEGDNCDDY